MLGGHAIARMLAVHEVGPIFGMGGFQLLPLYDGIAELGLQHHLVNDERSGAFAADAYARITRRPGVCDGTLGPGATNLITGLVESLNAGIPVVAIIGNTHRSHSWKNMTQESRQIEILRPAVKELIRIEDAARIPELVRRAFAVATSGRPGPVVIDVPEDVAHESLIFRIDEFYAESGSSTIPLRRTRPPAELVDRAADMLHAAQRPMALVGGGIHLSNAHAELARLATSLAMPIAHTMSGKGAVAGTDRLSAGLFGRYSRIANDMITASDCLLVVGCKLGEIATKRYELLPRGVPIIQIDIDAEELGRSSEIALALWGDAALALADLTDAIRRRGAKQTQLPFVESDLSARLDAWHETAVAAMESEQSPIHMARVIQELNRQMPPDGILVADGGFAAHWSALLYETKTPGRTFVADRGFASIGYGLPGAIGAALAHPSGPVVALTGDAGFNMSMGELETALRIGLGITIVVANNAASGYVKALQHAVFDGRYQSADLHELDYAAIARAFGCDGIRVEDTHDLGPALQDALGQKARPTVIDVIVTRDPAQMLPGIDSRTAVKRTGR